MNKSTSLLTLGLNAVAFISTGVQPDEVLQWVSLAVTLIATIASLALTIWKWVIAAKKDGKITPEEIDDLQEIIKPFKKEEKEEND